MYQDCVQVNCRLTLKYAILVTLIELNVNTSARAHSVLAALTVYCSWFFSYRELPSLAKNYVIRMLFLDQPLPQAAVALWVKKDSQKWVSTPAPRTLSQMESFYRAVDSTAELFCVLLKTSEDVSQNTSTLQPTRLHKPTALVSPAEPTSSPEIL